MFCLTFIEITKITKVRQTLQIRISSHYTGEKYDVTSPWQHYFWMTTKPTTKAKEGEWQKSNRFLLTKQICTCITLFCTFLCRRCSPATWNFPSFPRLLYGVGEQNKKKSCLFPLLNVDTVLSDSTRGNFAYICQTKLNWIRSMKFEAVRIHFLSEV